ncbi:copper resistance CopC family protein [Aeromicrobium stalagmiti]|uniref:copper resistance CopC family protein n=1 Tax=Aeromicrobium stalagmiti TaxID=2738988 RepID=UPI001569C3E0|nr:copper resistance CopC family protein [Aeromicrobium stalagmiti]NRQ51744.1 copper resistance protein CopC [Aeromicrobium stalagmiti]
MKLRTLIAAAVTTLAIAVTPSAASAHAALADSNPKDGATLTALPDQVTISLNEPVRDPAQIAVLDESGTRVNSKTVTVADKTASSQILDQPAPGKYTMSYRVVSADGHSVTGTINFAIEAPTPPTPTAAAPPATSTSPDDVLPDTAPSPTPSDEDLDTTSADNGDDSRTLEIVIAVGVLAILVIAGATLFIRGGRNTSDPSDQD